MDEEILLRATLIRQESEEVEKELEYIKEQINELEKFREALKFLEENGEKEILASVGKGVYLKSSREKNEKFFVEVGAGVLLRKTPKEAATIVNEQTIKFKEAKLQLTAQLHDYAIRFRELLKDVDGLRNKQQSE